MSVLATAWLIFGQRAPVPLGKPLLLFMGAFVLSTVFSIDWSCSVEQLAITAAGLLLFALAADLTARGWPAEMFARALLIVGLSIPIFMWWQAFGWYRQWLALNPGQWLPMVTYRPYYANVLVMPCYTMLFAAAARSFYTKSWFSRALLGFVMLLLLATIFLTSSRGGWIGTAAGLALLAGLLYWKRRQDVKALWGKVRAKRWLVTAGSALALIVLAGAGWLGLKILSHPSHGSFFNSRSFVWPAAIDTSLKHPMIGQGPYTFGNSYLAYNSVPPNAFYAHAHSAYLNLLAEMGLVGTLGAGVVVFFLFKRLKRRLETAQGMELSVVMAAAAGTLALGVHNIFDCFHTEPMAVVGLLVLLGAALGEPGRAVDRPRRRPYWVIAPALLVWAEVWMMAPMVSGVAAANAGDLSKAEASFLQAIRREPWSVIAHQQLGKVYALEGNLPGAVAELEQVVAWDTSWGLNWVNLAALYRQQSDLDKAHWALEGAVTASPDWGLAYLNLGIVAEEQGSPQVALAAYTQALSKGETAEFDFWQGSPARMEAVSEWEVTHPAAEQLSAQELRAAIVQEPDRPGPLLQLAKLDLEVGDLDETEALLQKVSLTFAYLPELMERDWLLAELHAARGEYAQAVGLGEGVVRRYEQSGLFGPATYADLHYEQFMYRRPGMGLEILPQVVRVEPARLKERKAQVEVWREGVGSDEP